MWEPWNFEFIVIKLCYTIVERFVFDSRMRRRYVLFEIMKKGNIIKIENTAQYKAGENIAVFVEFGVGEVGEETSKPKGFIENAITPNAYKYNVRTDNKRASKNPQSKFFSNDN